MQGILAFSQQSQPKPTEGHRTEFDAGYRGHKATVVTVALANLDNYWTLKVQLDAIRGMLPCDDPQCSHPIVRVDLDNRGSFVQGGHLHDWRVHLVAADSCLGERAGSGGVKWRCLLDLSRCPSR